MRSTMRATAPALLMLAVAGCAGSPVIVASPSACTKLIPETWRSGIAMADLPEAAAASAPNETPEQKVAGALGEQKKWESFGIDTANRLEQANGRTADAIGIVERCEARDAAAVKATRPKVLGIF